MSMKLTLQNQRLLLLIAWFILSQTHFPSSILIGHLEYFIFCENLTDLLVINNITKNSKSNKN